MGAKTICRTGVWGPAIGRWVGFLFLLMALSVKAGDSVGLKLYVLEGDAALRAEPGLSAEMLDLLKYGAVLRQINQRGRWFQVETAAGLRGWLVASSVGERSPVLPAGYGKVKWGQSRQEVQAATGATDRAGRLVKSLGAGTVEAIAYNFHEDRLFYVEIRYRLPSAVGFSQVVERARTRFGEPHGSNSQKWLAPATDSGEETWMEMSAVYWETGVTGFAIVSYSPLYDEGESEVRCEYWSGAIVAEFGLGKPNNLLQDLDF